MVETAHLLALAMLGGTVLLVNLGLLGVKLKSRSVASFAKELWPLFTGSLVIMVVSGAALVSTEAMKCYYHPAFRLKMAILALAVVFSFTAHRRAIERSPSRWSKPAAVASLTLWLGVGLAGRAIGFL